MTVYLHPSYLWNMTNTTAAAKTYTVTYNGETITQSTKRDVTYAVAMLDYHGDVVVVLSKNERTAAGQLKRDLASGYAVKGELIPLS